MKQQLHSHQQGFTLVELLIATTVFSVVLLAAAATLIQVGRLYYKGVVTSRTQNAARTVIDDISRTIQFSSGALNEATSPDNAAIKAYCVGDTRYTYILGGQVNSSVASGTAFTSENRQVRHVLWQDKISSGAEQCGDDMPNLLLDKPSGDDSDRQGRELLDDGMRLQNFVVSEQGSDSDIFDVGIKVVYGDQDLFNDPNNPTSCKGSVVGGQWCAISELNSVVYSRSR